jgi:hypothetical protein
MAKSRNRPSYVARSRSTPRPSYVARFVVHAPVAFVERVELLAQTKMTTVSALVREALLAKLEAEGHVGPSSPWPQVERDQAAAWGRHSPKYPNDPSTDHLLIASTAKPFGVH